MRNQHYVGQSGLSMWIENGRKDPVAEAVRIGGEALEKVLNGAGLDTLSDRELACLRGHLVDLIRAGDKGVAHLYPDVACEQEYREIRTARKEAEANRRLVRGEA